MVEVHKPVFPIELLFFYLFNDAKHVQLYIYYFSSFDNIITEYVITIISIRVVLIIVRDLWCCCCQSESSSASLIY